MTFDLIHNLQTCQIAVPQLLFYSHLPAMVMSFSVGLYIFLKNKQDLSVKIFLLISTLFSAWVLLDFLTWTTWTSYSSQMIMFLWSIMNLIEPMIYAVMLYFAYIFIKKKDVNFKYKLFFGLWFIPLIFLIPTSLNLSGFNIESCEAIQSNLIEYVYFLNIFFSVTILIFLAYSYIKSINENRRQILFFSIGLVLFLLAFSWANIWGNLTTNWEITQYGLFGMPVFLVFLGYLIVKYKAFNIKLIGAQALIIALNVLIGSQLFFVKTTTNQILTGITLFLSIVFGWTLIRSVRREVAQKEELIIANEKLIQLDQAKSEFISIASHQLRTPLTVIKGYISMILDGNFGRITVPTKESLVKVYESNERLISLVENLLNVSRIESGRLQFTFENKQLEDLVTSVCDELTSHAAKKNLKFQFIKPTTKLPSVRMDEEKLRQVVMNLIDNSIKYTPQGSVSVTLKKQGDKLLFCVSDSGIGVTASDMPNLFKKFSRGTGTSLIHTEGTGLGLFVVKQMIEAHGGRAWVESAGEHKGSKFYFEMPFVK